MKNKNIARFKRTITFDNTTSSNKKRVKIDPRTKYARKIREKANIINEMLDALEESGNINTWASKILYNKLDTNKINVIKNTRVNVSSITKNRSMSGLAYIDKALTDFKNSKTSTVKGIKQRVNDERQLIAEQTDNIEFANSLSDEEVGQIYEVFNDVNYKQLTESGLYDSDEIFSFVTTAKEQELGVQKFMRMVQTYSEESPDADTKRSFRNIYNKFIKYQ